jgi:O-methyltransferase
MKGWFQDTLPGFIRGFQPRPGNRLVLHLDADLYSSTLYVLSVLDPFITKDTILLFDEFDSVEHEFRAAIDYMSAFRRRLEPKAFAGPFYNQAALSVEE